MTVNGGKAYRAVQTMAAENIVEKYAEGEQITVVADAAPAGKAFDQWTADGVTLSEEQSTTSTMTFTMPAQNVSLTATYKERPLNEAELVAAAKEKAGNGVEIPYAQYEDEAAKAEAATKAVQDLIGTEVTVTVTYRGDHYALTLECGKAGATVDPFQVTVRDATDPTEEDRKAAEEVIAKIDAIGEVTLDSEAAIQVARDAYDKLTDTQKALVGNVDVLIAAEKKLEELKNSAGGNDGDTDTPDTVNPAPGYDWYAVLAGIKAAGTGSYTANVGGEIAVPHFIWQAFYGKDLTVTLQRGTESFVFNGLDLQNSGFDPDTGHNLTDLTAYVGRTYHAPEQVKPDVEKLAETAQPTEKPAATEEPTTTAESVPVQNDAESSNSAMLWVLLAVLAVGAMCGGFFWWKKNKKEN